MPGPGFWDLNKSLKCVQGGNPHINKLKKPEAVTVMMGLAWYFRTLPDVLGLLQKVRALAGRVTDGLGKPGTEPNVNHP